MGPTVCKMTMVSEQLEATFLMRVSPPCQSVRLFRSPSFLSTVICARNECQRKSSACDRSSWTHISFSGGTVGENEAAIDDRGYIPNCLVVPILEDSLNASNRVGSRDLTLNSLERVDEVGEVGSAYGGEARSAEVGDRKRGDQLLTTAPAHGESSSLKRWGTISSAVRTVEQRSRTAKEGSAKVSFGRAQKGSLEAHSEPKIPQRLPDDGSRGRVWFLFFRRTMEAAPISRIIL